MDATPVQQHMPRHGTGITTAVTIGGERFYLTANGRDDETLGEVFIQWGKQGQHRGRADGHLRRRAVGRSPARCSAGRAPRSGLGAWFVPNGRTDDPDIPRVASVVDYVARRLALDWLPVEERAALGALTLDELVARSGLFEVPRPRHATRTSPTRCERS